MRVKWWLAAALLLLGGAVGLAVLGRDRARPAPPGVSATPGSRPTAPSSPGPAQAPATPLLPVTLEGGRLTGSDPAGRVRWELQAATLETMPARREVLMAQVMGKFYEQGKLMVTVDARRAVFSVQTQDVTLSGEVHVRAADGRTLDADHVQWLAARRLVLANGNVRLTQARYVVQADRLESDIALQRTKLRGHIRVTVRE